jgi:hypothetical protein
MDARDMRRCNWRGTTTPPEKRSNRCDNGARYHHAINLHPPTTRNKQTNKQTKLSWAPYFRVILQWKGKRNLALGSTLGTLNLFSSFVFFFLLPSSLFKKP